MVKKGVCVCVGGGGGGTCSTCPNSYDCCIIYFELQ